MLLDDRIKPVRSPAWFMLHVGLSLSDLILHDGLLRINSISEVLGHKHPVMFALNPYAGLSLSDLLLHDGLLLLDDRIKPVRSPAWFMLHVGLSFDDLLLDDRLFILLKGGWRLLRLLYGDGVPI